MNNKLLVFPTSRAIREYIVAQQDKNTLLPKLITIDELFKNSIFLDNKKYIDENLRIIYLKESINQKQFDSLGLSSNLSDFFRQSDFIFRFLGELSHENIDIATLSTFDTYAHYIDHLDILKVIQKNYIDILDKHNLIDKLNLPCSYKINDTYVQSFESIEIYMEGYFSTFESTIIQQIAKLTNTIISFEYNIFNQKSIEQFSKNLDIQLNYHYTINLSTNEILKEDSISSTIPTPKLSAFSSKIDQIGYIKYAIYDLVENQGISPEDIVVVTPDESFGKTLKLFDKEHYFNFAFGFDITSSNTYQFITSIERELNEREQQTKEKIQFLDIEASIIEELRKVWNKQFDIEFFEQFNNYIFEQENNNDIKQEYEKIVYSIIHLCKTNSLELKFKELFKIIIQKLSKVTLDDTQGGKITVMGILETRAIEFKGVIVCDFNDNIVPRKSTKDKFLSTHIKKLANLPTSQDRQNLQIYYYNKLFQNAKHLYISYVENDESTISRFSSTLFPNTKLSPPQDKNYRDILYIDTKIENLDDEVIIDNIDLSTKSWSASSLKRYLECKRKYYYHDILKIKEHHFSFKPQNFEIGTLLHDILERIYLKNSAFLNVQELYNVFLKELSQEKKGNPYLTFEIELWKKKIKKFIENEIDRFNQGIKVDSCEKHFRTQYHGININGKIDRIDIHKDGKVDILDYKTSRSLSISSEKNYDKSVDFQLEFYYLALEENYQINEVAYYDLNNGKVKPEIALEQKLLRLEEIFESLKTSQVNFEKCDNKPICSICTYNTICKKD